MGHFWVIFAVLKIVVGHRTFSGPKIDICLNKVGQKVQAEFFLETTYP